MCRLLQGRARRAAFPTALEWPFPAALETGLACRVRTRVGEYRPGSVFLLQPIDFSSLDPSTSGEFF